VCVAVLSVAFAMAAVTANAADEGEVAEPSAGAELAKQIEELRKLLEDVRTLNEEEVRKLRERIAELEAKLERYEAARGDEDLSDIRAEAEAAAAEEAEKEKAAETERETATGRERALQATNPEISFVGDVSYDWTSGPMKDGFLLRGAEVAFQAALDPYTRFKAYLAGHQEPFELDLEAEDGGHTDEHGSEIALNIEEMYVEWVALPGNMRIYVGKFRQQYGTLNRWHRHALASTDTPFALRNAFGFEGLVGLGVGFSWQLPNAGPWSPMLRLEVTNAENPVAFAGSEWRAPAVLFRFTNFFDLGTDGYVDFGLNAVTGPNDESGDTSTTVAGIDLNFLWEPAQMARYRNIELRGEWIHVRFEEPAGEKIDTDSFYAYLSFKLNRRWFVGLRWDDATLPFDRFDLYDPDTLEDLDFEAGLRERALTPFLTWWQSEYVRLRLQYQRVQRDFVAAWGRETDDKLWVQVTFAAGPHKHDSY
jgi:hypothetical protein